MASADRPARHDSISMEAPSISEYILLMLALAVLGTLMWRVRGFFQDDAYISLRYASNLINGHGLVFNQGERVEGITNLGWTLLAAIALEIGLSGPISLQILGASAAIALVYVTWLEARQDEARPDGPRGRLTRGCIASLLLAGYGPLSIWSMSGLEQSAFAFAIFQGYRCFAGDNAPGAARWWLIAGLLRPEGIIAAISGLGAYVQTLMRTWQGRRPICAKDTRALVGFLGGMAVLTCFRVSYYGDIVPNTYFVKAVASWESHRVGIQDLILSLSLGGLGWMLAATVLGVAGAWRRPERRPMIEARFAAWFSVLYLYYLVRIGGDPALGNARFYVTLTPFWAVWSARAVSWLSDACTNDRRQRRWWIRQAPRSLSLGLLLVFLNGIDSALVLESSYSGVHARLLSCHGKMARRLRDAQLRQGQGRAMVIIAQDMGLVPFLVPDARFIDVIGLTDRTIARRFYEAGVATYLRSDLDPSVEERIHAVDLEIGDYLRDARADYVIASVYEPELAGTRPPLHMRDSRDVILHASRNALYHGIFDLSWFHSGYELVDGCSFSDEHFLLLFKRRATPLSPP